jgi:hypothetical protein
MGNSYLKNWLQKTQNQQAINRALQIMQTKGYALPCRVVSVSGSIVTVAFEIQDDTLTIPQVTIPKAESQWIRTPTQIDEYGVTLPADAYLGGISGLGGGTANMTRRGNLSSLVYVPCANKSYPSVNPNVAYIAGPAGAVIQTQDGTSSVVVNDSGITLTFGSKVVSLSNAGFTIDGILFDSHKHLYSPGTGAPTDTGGPVS